MRPRTSRGRGMLLLGLGLILGGRAEAQQTVALPGVPLPSVIRVRSPDGVPASNTLVRVLETGSSAFSDSDGRAVLPPLPAGDHLVLLQSQTDGVLLRGIVARGFADTAEVRMVRRAPSVDEYLTTNVLPDRLRAVVQRRANGIGRVLAASRLHAFRTVGEAIGFLAGPSAVGCLRVGLDGRAPEGATPVLAFEIPNALTTTAAPVAPAGRTSDDDAQRLDASTTDWQALEWIDAPQVPLVFRGVPTGCGVVVLWR